VTRSGGSRCRTRSVAAQTSSSEPGFVSVSGGGLPAAVRSRRGSPDPADSRGAATGAHGKWWSATWRSADPRCGGHPHSAGERVRGSPYVHGSVRARGSPGAPRGGELAGRRAPRWSPTWAKYVTPGRWRSGRPVTATRPTRSRPGFGWPTRRRPCWQAWFEGMNPQLDDVAPARVLREQPLEQAGPAVIAAARAFAAQG